MIKKGFTLIELLVVISIIGILAAIITVSFTSSQRQARDTKRKSDLAQYRNALEAFANKTSSLYPLYSGTTDASSTLCTTLGETGCPEDPKNPVDSSIYYKYQSNGSGSTGAASATEYVLWAQLENLSNTYWVVCSNGKSGTATSGLPPSGGVCPL